MIMFRLDRLIQPGMSGNQKILRYHLQLLSGENDLFIRSPHPHTHIAKYSV